MKRLVVLAMLIASGNLIYGQKALNIIPPSPNATAIQKFGEVPVSLYAGLPEISIPLFNISVQDFQLPISLKYHSSGIKVMEYASSVGLGWALNAGGVISRTTNGLPDDCTYGFLNPTVTKYIKYQYIDPTNSNQEDYNTQKNYANGVWDSEPDMFYFNFEGYSGKFLFDQNRGIHIIPNQNLKIEVNPGLRLNEFVITTENGNKYIFSDNENISSYSTTYGSGLPPSTAPSSPCNSVELASSWYLSKIITRSNQSIDFKYNSGENGSELSYNYFTNYNTQESVSKVIRSYTDLCSPIVPGVPSLVKYVNTSTRNYGKRLTYIKFPLGKIRFIYNNNRADLSGDKMLDEILIQNEFDNVIKSFNLNYLYSNSQGGFTESSNVAVTSENQDNIKLFLSQISEKNSFGNKSLPPYKFIYEENVPGRSNSLYNADWWGYYNGKDKDVSIGKNPMLQFLKCGTLKRIQYPTGGFTDFEFEKNSCQPSAEWSQGILNENQNSVSLSSYPSNIETCTSPTPCRKEKLFSISNNNASGSDINLSIFLQCQNPTQCSASFSLYNTQTNALVFSSNSIGSLPYPSPTYIPPSPGGNNVYSLTNWLIFLPNGSYLIRYTNSDNQYNPTATNQNNITLKWRTTDGSTNAPAGGLRIKKISNFTGDNLLSTSKIFDYNNLDNSGFPSNNSSGSILTSPIPKPYEQKESYGITCTVAWGYVCSLIHYDLETNNLICPFPLSTTNGSFVGYSNIIEYNNSISNNNGRTIYKYTSPLDYPLPQRPEFPFILNDNLESARGLLTEKTDYSKLSYGYVPIKKTLNSYTNFYGRSIQANPNQGSPPITGLRVTPLDIRIPIQCSGQPDLTTFKNSFLVLSESYSLLNATTDISYNQNGTSLSQTTNFFYEDINNLAVTKKETLDSKANLISTNIKYPTSFPSISPYDVMINQNFISPIIETQVSNVTKNKELEKTRTNYTFVNNQVLPLNFQKSINGGIIELETSVDKYDTKGNILQTTDRNGIMTSYIWGYNSQYPVAKVVNGTYDNIISVSGINLPLIDDPNVLDVNLRSELNKIRQLTGYFVTTYTFSPLIGMTSETDPNNRTKYYEYDGFNRLTLVRDQNNNILKRICYNYAGQVEDCN